MKREFANFLRRIAEKVSPMDKSEYLQLDDYQLQEASYSVLVGSGKIAHCQRYDQNASKTLRHEAEYQANQRLLKELQMGGGIRYDYREDTSGILVTATTIYAKRKL